jgi:hypothetical protein
MNYKKLKDTEINYSYEQITKYFKEYLKDLNVKLPHLYSNKQYTKDALTLVYLAHGYPNTNVVSKEELTHFIKNYYPNTNDVQQARHLSAQKGWYILSGTRKDNFNNNMLKAGEYKLLTLEKPYPSFNAMKRVDLFDDDYWAKLLIEYSDRCATCGSKNGERSYKWSNVITFLQKGHMDPTKQLEPGNIIPQCESCNRADLNNWIYNKKGRVVAVANPRIIERSNTKVQKEIYLILKDKFDK